MTTLDDLLTASRDDVRLAASDHGAVEDALRIVHAASDRRRRRTRFATVAAATVVILLVVATAIAAARRGGPVLDVGGPAGSTSTVSPTTAAPTTMASGVTETTVVEAPTTAMTAPSTPTSRTTVPVTILPQAPPTSSPPTTTVAPPTSAGPTVHRPAPGPHPDPLPGTGTSTGSGETAWEANIPARYTFRLMYWAPGNPQPLGPLDLTVERRTNGAGIPTEVVVAAYDPNAGVDIDPANVAQYTIGMIWEGLQEFVGCQCISGTAATGQPVNGVFSVLVVQWGANSQFRFEISGFWLE